MNPINSNQKPFQQNIKRKRNSDIGLNSTRRISRYEDNLAPSVSKVDNLAEGIMEHAHLRLQMFYAVACELQGYAKRTNGDITDVEVWVGRATKQDGQGTRQDHAAHSNAAAGLSDNLKKHYIEQIVADGLTPVKTNFLRCVRKMPLLLLDELQKNHTDEEHVRGIIELVWPGNSAIAETELEDKINATDKLPRNLNLGCDLTLEKAIRPLVAELITSVMKGELTSVKATDRYTDAIQVHFGLQLKKITNQIKELKKAEYLDLNALKRAEDQLFYHQTEMNGTNTLDYESMDCKKKLKF